MKISSDPAARLRFLECAMIDLRSARSYLARAGAPKTLDATRAAISSCKGALRNADNRKFKATRPS